MIRAEYGLEGVLGEDDTLDVRGVLGRHEDDLSLDEHHPRAAAEPGLGKWVVRAGPPERLRGGWWSRGGPDRHGISSHQILLLPNIRSALRRRTRRGPARGCRRGSGCGSAGPVRAPFSPRRPG